MSNRTLVRVAHFVVETMNDDLQDSYQNFRESTGTSLTGSDGYAPVISGLARCNWERTPNYDTPGTVGQTKEDNIFTANNFCCGYNDDLQPEDYVQVFDIRGAADWGMVKGAPKRDSRTNRQYAYVVPTSKPLFIGGS